MNHSRYIKSMFLSLLLLAFLLPAVAFSRARVTQLAPKDCDALSPWEAQLSCWQAREAAAKSRLAELGDVMSQADNARSKVASLDSQIAALRSDISNSEARWSQLESYPDCYGVVKNDWLAKIAGYEQIYNDYSKWPRIYRENKGQIKDPNLIFPRQVFKIPR